jgi:hypothetical protein
MICAKSGQNYPSDSGEEVENVKVYRQTDGRQTTGDQKSSLETYKLGVTCKLPLGLG